MAYQHVLNDQGHTAQALGMCNYNKCYTIQMLYNLVIIKQSHKCLELLQVFVHEQDAIIKGAQVSIQPSCIHAPHTEHNMLI